MLRATEGKMMNKKELEAAGKSGATVVDMTTGEVHGEAEALALQLARDCEILRRLKGSNTPETWTGLVLDMLAELDEAKEIAEAKAEAEKAEAEAKVERERLKVAAKLGTLRLRDGKVFAWGVVTAHADSLIADSLIAFSEKAAVYQQQSTERLKELVKDPQEGGDFAYGAIMGKLGRETLNHQQYITAIAIRTVDGATWPELELVDSTDAIRQRLVVLAELDRRDAANLRDILKVHLTTAQGLTEDEVKN